MKRLVIILVLLLILAGAGAGGWWFFLRPAPDEAAADAGSQPEASAEGIVSKSAIEFDPIILPILREGRVRRHMTFVLTLEMDRPLSLDKISELKPRLRDAFLSELHGIYAFRRVQEGDAPMPVIRWRLARAGERVLGPGAVKGVFFKYIGRRDLPAG